MDSLNFADVILEGFGRGIAGLGDAITADPGTWLWIGAGALAMIGIGLLTRRQPRRARRSRR